MLHRYLSLLLFGFLAFSIPALSAHVDESLRFLSSSEDIIKRARRQITSSQSFEDLLTRLSQLHEIKDYDPERAYWQSQFETIAIILNQLHFSWQRFFVDQTLDKSFLEQLRDDEYYQTYLQFCGLINELFRKVLAEASQTHSNLVYYSLPSTNLAIAMVTFHKEDTLAVTYQTTQAGFVVKRFANLFAKDGSNFRQSLLVVKDGRPFLSNVVIVVNNANSEEWLTVNYFGENAKNPFSVFARRNILFGFNGKRGHREIHQELLTDPTSILSVDGTSFLVVSTAH